MFAQHCLASSLILRHLLSTFTDLFLFYIPCCSLSVCIEFTFLYALNFVCFCQKKKRVISIHCRTNIIFSMFHEFPKKFYAAYEHGNSLNQFENIIYIIFIFNVVFIILSSKQSANRQT